MRTTNIGNDNAYQLFSSSFKTQVQYQVLLGFHCLSHVIDNKMKPTLPNFISSYLCNFRNNSLNIYDVQSDETIWILLQNY